MSKRIVELIEQAKVIEREDLEAAFVMQMRDKVRLYAEQKKQLTALEQDIKDLRELYQSKLNALDETYLVAHSTSPKRNK